MLTSMEGNQIHYGMFSFTISKNNYEIPGQIQACLYEHKTSETA